MRVVLRAEARNDLVEGAAFYDAQRNGLGDYYIDCLFRDLEALEREGPIHEMVYGLHRRLSDRFPFAIYYQVVGELLEVVGVLDCRHNPDDSAERLIRRTS